MSTPVTAAMPILLMVPVLSLAAEADSARPGLSLSSSLVQMILGLALILVLIVGAAWLLRRFMPLRGGDGAIRVLGGLSLGSRERVVLLQVGETRLLVGVSPGRVATLHVLDEQEGAFARELATARKGNHHE